jgi:hypothetical protein
LRACEQCEPLTMMHQGISDTDRIRLAHTCDASSRPREMIEIFRARDQIQQILTLLLQTLARPDRLTSTRIRALPTLSDSRMMRTVRRFGGVLAEHPPH